jgi:hypothetical protein
MHEVDPEKMKIHLGRRSKDLLLALWAMKRGITIEEVPREVQSLKKDPLVALLATEWVRKYPRLLGKLLR